MAVLGCMGFSVSAPQPNNWKASQSQKRCGSWTTPKLSSAPACTRFTGAENSYKCLSASPALLAYKAWVLWMENLIGCSCWDGIDELCQQQCLCVFVVKKCRWTGTTCWAAAFQKQRSQKKCLLGCYGLCKWWTHRCRTVQAGVSRNSIKGQREDFNERTLLSWSLCSYSRTTKISYAFWQAETTFVLPMLQLKWHWFKVTEILRKNASLKKELSRVIKVFIVPVTELGFISKMCLYPLKLGTASASYIWNWN